MELKIATWNIRGANTIDKQNEVRNLIQKEHLCMCAVLETHLKTKTVTDVSNYMFGNWEWISNVDYSPSSCRMVIGWDPNKVRVMVVHMAKQVTRCLVETVVDRSKMFCSFVYANNNGNERRMLWSDLYGHKLISRSHPWVLLGDFNVILKVHEHSAGGSYMTKDMIEFQDCVNKLEVEDICKSGFQFTWTKSLKNPNCDVLKKLDRVMANEDFIKQFGSAHAVFLPYLISDHSPSILTIPEGLVFKPKAFRFMNYTADKDDFIPVVEKGWQLEVIGHHMYRVVRKLKALKKNLNKLNWKNGNVFSRVVDLKEKLSQIQASVDSNPFNKELKADAVKILEEYKVACSDELKVLKKKVRLKWLMDGDKNSKYFHSVLKARKNKSRVESICNDQG
ncbi:uncharacterized protein [Rutidosis leptorrhynchoides]|uniref:uncharacterized protein n=1 Tax=Rutidosis leptorrhynchoides TaxID=125765 RepID=UPI003A9A5074